MHPTTCASTTTSVRFKLLSIDRITTLKDLFEIRGTPCSFARNNTIASEEAPIERVYRIESGIVRCCSFTEDGLRQIFAFAGPGDLIGFPDLDAWHFTAEAVGPTTARFLKPETLDAALLGEPMIAKALRRHCVSQFEQRERHLIWLSYLQSEDRLLAFLQDFGEPATDDDGFINLPMTRQDMGDHLGMTLETVSRCFGCLRRRGAIEMDGANRYRLTAPRDHATAA
ncbi:MAG: helix-turn-helix domain-containing protein [Pseudomonadota bacterium]